MRYASSTNVSAVKSRAEIEHLVYQYAGRDTNFSYGQMSGQAAILFEAFGRKVKFTVPLPTAEEGRTKAKRKNGKQEPSAGKIDAWRDQEERRRWRALLLVIKAKLEAVQSNICTFDEEFLAHIIPDDGDKTIYERITTGFPEHRRLLPAVEVPSSRRSK